MAHCKYWVLIMKIFKLISRLVLQLPIAHMITLFSVIIPAFAEPPAPNQLPTVGTLLSGQASILQTGAIMTINQSTSKAAISWTSFDIGSGSKVNINQPNKSSVLLNQVLSSNPTQIFGNLNANGQVFLTNPSGVYFSPSANVNVGGLVATTNTISATDFMAGLSTFYNNGSTAGVINEGNLSAHLAGYIALLAPNVINNGVIVAQMGTIAMAAGQQYVLQFIGNSLNAVAVTPATIATLVANANAVYAPGGLIIMSAQAARQIQGGIIGNTGVLDATGITSNGGVIQLTASNTIDVGGTIKANAGSLSALNGGRISIISDLSNPISQTNVRGLISADASNLGGNGGSIETSASILKVNSSAIISTRAPNGVTGNWTLDPTNFVVDSALNAGDITGATLAGNLLASNVTILSSNGKGGTLGDIQINQPVNWVGATTLTLNAVHDVIDNSAINSTTGYASLMIIAGHNATINANLSSVGGYALINVNAGNNILIGPGSALTATAASASTVFNAGLDFISSGSITSIGASSSVSITAGRDVTTLANAAIVGVGAGIKVAVNAGRNINIGSPVSVNAAGASLQLISGLSGTTPGINSGTVVLNAAVASPNLTIRFNPDGYANTAADIALYPALSDSRAWVYAKGINKVYDSNTSATLGLDGFPLTGSGLSLISGTANFNNPNVGLSKSITYNNFGLAGSSTSSYALLGSSGTTSANITPMALNVIAVGNNKVYDGTTVATANLSATPLQGDTLNLVYTSASFTDANVGAGKVVNVSGISGSSNYSFNNNALTSANISPANLTLTASNYNKIYGQIPVLTGFTQSGLVNNETVGNLNLVSPGQLPTAGVLSGPYVINASNASGGTFNSSNYSISYLPGLLFVRPVGLLITVADALKPYGSTIIPTSFTVDGLVNGETVGSLNETSPGAAANASSNGNPYVITPGVMSGGTFNPTNYNIKYVNGTLTVIN